MEQIRVLEVDMPLSVKGFVKRITEEEGDFYTICINSSLSNEMKYFTIVHELTHINEGDFFNSAPVGLLERERHI